MSFNVDDGNRNDAEAPDSMGGEGTVKQAYDRWHEEIAVWQAEDNANSPWHVMAKQHLQDIRDKRVLEIGCGRGGFSKYLLEQGAHLTAADFSSAAIDLTRQLLRGVPHCETLVADIQAIPHPDNYFDVVVSLETLEHVPDPDKGLAELIRVARPGGKIIVTTPNYFGLLGLYRHYRELTGRPYTEVGQPINNPLTVKDRVRKLRKLGCRIDAVDGCGHYLYVPRRDPQRLAWLDNPRFVMKWLATHSLTVATKPEAN